MNLIQQKFKQGSWDICSKIKGYGSFLLRWTSVFFVFLFNKWQIMSLFSVKDVVTFVSSTNTDRFHLPMAQNTTYYSFPSSPATGVGKMLLTAAMILVCIVSNAQGWEIYFGGPNEDFGHSIIQARN